MDEQQRHPQVAMTASLIACLTTPSKSCQLNYATGVLAVRLDEAGAGFC